MSGDATGVASSVAFASLVSVPVVMDDYVDDWISRQTGVHNISSWASLIGYQTATLFAARLTESLTINHSDRRRMINHVGVAGIAATAAAYFGTTIVHQKSYGIVSELEPTTVLNATYIGLFYGFFAFSLSRILVSGLVGLSVIRRGPLAVTYGLITAGAVAEIATVSLLAAKQIGVTFDPAVTFLRESLLTGGALLLAGAVVSYNWEKIHGRVARFRRLNKFVNAWASEMRVEGALRVLQPSKKNIWVQSATTRSAGDERIRLADISDAVAATRSRKK